VKASAGCLDIAEKELGGSADSKTRRA